MTHEKIFEKYLDDKCPICDSHKDSDDYRGHTESGGKVMAMHFVCSNCNSEYTVGMNRSRMPIESKITINGLPTVKFKCYEIHTVQARMVGCTKQCNECKNKELC